MNIQAIFLSQTGIKKGQSGVFFSLEDKVLASLLATVEDGKQHQFLVSILNLSAHRFGLREAYLKKVSGMSSVYLERLGRFP